MPKIKTSSVNLLRHPVRWVFFRFAIWHKHGGEISNAKLYSGQLPTLQQRRAPFDIYNDLLDDEAETLPGQRRRRIEQP